MTEEGASGRIKEEAAAAGIDLTSAEFQDADGNLFEEGPGFDFSRLLSPASLRGLAAMVVAIFLIALPDRSPRLLAWIIAGLLIVWSLGGAIDLIRERTRDLFTVMRLTLLIGIALTVILWPRVTGEDLARIVGAGLAIAGLAGLLRAYRGRNQRSMVEPAVGALFYTAIGVALLISPKSLFSLAILGISIYWFIAGVATIVTNVREDDEEILPSQTWQSFLRWVQSRPNTADDRLQLYAKIFYEGAEGPRRLSRFFALMAFATAIAFFGIAADSTAVVIGAMLVAPLMTPLMGTSLAMVMGWPRRASMTGAVALGGIALAIGLSILFGWVLGGEISPVTNSQVSSRIAPTLVDLMIAIAAGGAGAFAMSRPDVSDSLPGVAVAIALVPPLAVVGLMISQNDWTEALGALLLFVTNLVAILLVGALVFVITGVVPLYQISQNARRVKLSLGMAATLGVVVIAVLATSTEDFRAQAAGTEAVGTAVAAWSEGTNIAVQSVDVKADEVTVVVNAPDPPPPVEDLAKLIEQEWGRFVSTTVFWIPRESFVYDVTEE